MNTGSQPGRGPQLDEEHLDYRELEQCFDADLIVEPFHDKRYSHFAHGRWAAFPEQWLDHQDPFHPSRRQLWLLLLLLAVTTLLVYWLVLTLFKNDTSTQRRLPTIRITLDSNSEVVQPVIPANEPVEPEPKPLTASEPEQLDVPAEVNEVVEANSNAELLLEEPLTQDDTEPKPFDLYSSIESIGKSWADKKQDHQPPGNSLADDGVVFDAKLRDKLDSEFVQKLNRWRPPVDKPVLMSQETTFFVLGDKCYSVSENTPGFAPLISRIDCDKVFYNGRITREDLRDETGREFFSR